MAGQAKLLKRTQNRSVTLEQRDGGAVVVKRFEHSGLIARGFDARRARGEFRMLERLFQAGVPVPRPIAVVREGRAHAVSMQWIEGASTLDQMLEREDPRTRGAALAAELGRLLGLVHNARVDHPDLHTGNVLVDTGGRAFAVDFDKARLRRKLPADLLVRDLVTVCAGLRERTEPRWRRLALEAWWQTLCPELKQCAPRPEPGAVEALARERRRAVVCARERRFLRGGTAVESVHGAGGVARRGLDPEVVREALRGAEPRGGFQRVTGTARELERLWRSMARAEEHGLPAPRCALWIPSPRPVALFQSPAEIPPPLRSAPSAPRLAGLLLGSLLDRGLWCPDLGPEDLTPQGFARPLTWVDSAPREAAQRLAPWWARWGSAGSAAHLEFAAGVRAAWRGPRAEVQELLAQARGR